MAHVVLIDESRFFLNPMVGHTWAARDRTPMLTLFDRHWDKGSTIVAISMAPQRRRLGLYRHTDHLYCHTDQRKYRRLRRDWLPDDTQYPDSA